MQDEVVFEQLRNSLREAAEIRNGYQELANRMEAVDRISARLLADYLAPIYAGWWPAIGDSAVFVDIMEGIYFPVVVRDVQGRHIRTQPLSPKHTAFYSISLDLPAEDYVKACCIVPSLVFETLRDALPLRLAPFVQ